MSIVAEILESIKHCKGMEGVNTGSDGVFVELVDFAKEASEAKVAVVKALKGRYVDLCSVLHDTTLLENRVRHDLQKMEAFKSTLDGEVAASVAASADSVSSITGRWQEAVQGLQMSQQLLTAHQALRRASELASTAQYLFAAKSLTEVEEVLSTIEDDGIEIVPSILEELCLQRSSLIYELSEVWHKMFLWEEELSDIQHQTNTLTMRSQRWEQPEEGRAEVALVLAALAQLQELQPLFSILSNNILNKFFKILITKNAEISFDSRGSTFSVSVSHVLSSSDTSSNQNKPSYIAVFDKLEKMSMVLTELLINECLASAVPYSRKKLPELEAVQAATDKFHATLTELGFYSGSEADILKYASNVDTVFSDKACAHLLETARDLITAPLHHTVTITPQDSYPPLAVQDVVSEDDSGVRLEAATLRLEKLLAAKTFHLPQCQVSSSICELMELVHETLEEACSSSALFAGRLLCTARNILVLYDHVTPVAHAHTLLSIPQHAALVHNNSMYVATHCYLMGHHYRHRLPSELRETGPCVTSFTDLGYQITQRGIDLFLKAMQQHKKELLDTIAQAQGAAEVPADSGVRQCVQQLQRLRSVWLGVLPLTVYNKSIGTLLNSVVQELIDRTLAVEDISVEAATTLQGSLSLLKDAAPALFSTSAEGGAPEGVSGVRQWGRFLELQQVLGASLRELQDRWADGKGPLALYFTADQTKSLIRALFQNTERRAQVLAHIKVL